MKLFKALLLCILLQLSVPKSVSYLVLWNYLQPAAIPVGKFCIIIWLIYRTFCLLLVKTVQS